MCVVPVLPAPLTGSTTIPAPFRTASLTIWQARRTLVALLAPTAICTSAILNRPAGGGRGMNVSKIASQGDVEWLCHSPDMFSRSGIEALLSNDTSWASLPGHGGINRSRSIDTQSGTNYPLCRHKPTGTHSNHTNDIRPTSIAGGYSNML